MVGEVDEHLRVLVRLEGGAVGGVAQKHVVEVLRRHVFATVINLATVIHIDACSTTSRRLVEDLAFEWI